METLKERMYKLGWQGGNIHQVEKAEQEIKNNNYIFNKFDDPGHGWLEVAKTWLDKLPIDKTKLECSYSSKLFVYLEEDCDMYVFMDAFKAKFGYYPQVEKNYTDNQSPIRNLPLYREGN